MQRDDITLVPVQLEWDGWQVTEVPLEELHDVHWFQPPRAPRPLLHAYVSAGRLAAPTAADRDRIAATPGRRLVCVLKRHTVAHVYDHLARQADTPRTTRALADAHI